MERIVLENNMAMSDDSFPTGGKRKHSQSDSSYIDSGDK